ncbi:MAG: hypothetical protein LiPW15_432 [Parcubacteria group bacterium LiPW_15]|nr:MAG: hypothetical protein LiPW15_432 [Parcubacteria group bacterium LiPW_15]
MPRAKAKPTKIREYKLETRYVGDKIEVRRILENVKKYKFLNRDHPLVAELGEDKYAVVTRFGAVSFWNATESLIREFLNEIDQYIEKGALIHRHTDSLEIFVGAEEEKTTFEELFLKTLDVEKIKIISYVSAQSVALDRYEEEIDVRLHELGQVVAGMKSGKKAAFNQSDVLRQVGNVLSVKQTTVSRLSLFDKPDETWKKEEIEQLYNRLRTEYELRDRFDVLNEKIDFLSENNVTLLNYLSSQKSNYLEIWVIILIVVEIALFIVEILMI